MILATDLIQRNMDECTPLGNFLMDELTSGDGPCDNTVTTLLRGAVDSPECQHYGYVLDGFPTFNGFDEQLIFVEKFHLKPDIIIHIEVSSTNRL